MADPDAAIVAETQRLVIRREQPGDLAVWLEHMNTPQVMAMVGGVQPIAKVTELRFSRTISGSQRASRLCTSFSQRCTELSRARYSMTGPSRPVNGRSWGS